jgi:hypothetical protein
MHFTYEESCEAVGYSRDPRVRLSAPVVEYEYVGYVKGVVVKCSTIAEYDKFKLKEKIPTEKSKLAYDAVWAKQEELEHLAYKHFNQRLKDYFSELSHSQFELCWSKAWEDGHSVGYDKVASYLEDYVELCQKFNSV